MGHYLRLNFYKQLFLVLFVSIPFAYSAEAKGLLSQSDSCIIVISGHSPFGINVNEQFDEIRMYYDISRGKMCLLAHVYEEPNYKSQDLETGKWTTVEGRKRIGPEFITFECDASYSFYKAICKFANNFIKAPDHEFESSFAFYDGLNYHIHYGNKVGSTAFKLYGGDVEVVLWKVAMAIRFSNSQSIESSIPRIKELTRLCKRNKHHQG